MNKKLRSTGFLGLVFFLFGGFSNAQSVEITNPQYFLTGPALDALIELSLTVKNVSATSKNIKVERTTIFEVTGSENNFCWGLSCYPPFVSISPDYTTIPAGQSEFSFKGDYNPKENVGNTQIKYCFFVDGNMADSTCILVDFYAYAIENAELEAWTTTQGKDEPDGWFTSNDAIFNAQESIKKSADSQSGFAARIETVNLVNNPFTSVLANDAGFILYGSIDTLSSEILGKPFVGMPNKIEFYSKYQPAGIDTFTVSAVLTRWDAVTETREVVATGKFVSSNPETSYTMKSFVMDYQTANLSDSIHIFVSSSSMFEPKEGTVLFFDGLFASQKLVNVKKIADAKQPVKVFPNPAKETLFISSGSKGTMLEVYDLSGRIIERKNIQQSNGELIKLDVSAYKAGLYIFSVVDGAERINGKFSVTK
jgi:hypothetical protein